MVSFEDSIISFKYSSESPSSIWPAIWRIVGLSSKSRISKLTSKDSEMSTLNFISDNEVNPRAYKSSVTPKPSALIYPDTISRSFPSVSLTGATFSNTNFGSGRFLTSVLPFAVCGISSNSI